MRVMVFFDLPTLTLEDKREYRTFRNYLIKRGFIMVQESVYSKIVLNGTVARSVTKTIKENRPKSGLVQMLVVTEKQYAGMEYIVGEEQTSIIDSDERLVIL